MKHVKCNLDDLFNMDIQYFDFYRVYDKNENGGYRYMLCNPLTDEQRAALKQFKNVSIGSCHYRYAPEIKHDTLVLFDKCIFKGETV